ncbi:transposase [Aliivibrio wodanis]|uniref:transposase n=1 Tax=Aliivibrio wodanis TaxID=80852 RepID=UPI00406CEB60
MGKQRKSAYAEEFRKEAVRLSQLPDRTATQVTKQLGVNAQQIANWKTSIYTPL